MEQHKQSKLVLKDIPTMEKDDNPWKNFNFVSGISPRYYTKTMAELQLDMLGNSSRTSLSLPKYSRDQIVSWLQNPETNSKNLRGASIYLYEVSTQYRRLITYFSTLISGDYVVVPYKLDTDKADPEKVKAAYKKSCDWLQVLNIKQELPRILSVAYREDVFYGYLLHEKDSAHIQKLDPDFCRISRIVDSTFVCAFDFSYFDSHSEELTAYSEEFAQKYNAYKGDSSLRWQELDLNHQFCIKITDSMYPSPILPFGGAFEYIYRILDYTDLQQTREELENYKVLVLEIPRDKDNNLAMDKDVMEGFYHATCNVLPKSVGAVVAPCKVQDISFDRSNAADSDLTTKAITDFWNTCGTSGILFGGEQTAASLAISIKADIAMAMAVIRQVERVINRLLKTNISGTQKFQTNFLEISPFTQKEKNELYLKNAQYGLPTKMMAAATTGLTPSDIAGLTFLESDCLNLKEKWIPLQSSHTTTESEGDAGRPEDQIEDITDSAEKAKEYK